jgi:hypothetical protein
MAMTRKLLVVATLAWVAPLSAHQGPRIARHHSASCPHERARAAALERAATPMVAQATARPAVIVEATPGTAAMLGLRPSAAFMP